MTPPLWEILLKLNQMQPDTALTCGECYAILDYLAEKATQGADLSAVVQAIHTHVIDCPGCREYYLKRLKEFNTGPRD